jgi:subtilisin family serine protease
MAKRKRSSSSRSSKKSSTRRSVPLNESFSDSLDDDLSGGLEGDGGDEEGLTTGRMLMTVLDPDKSAVKAAIHAISGMTGMSDAASRVMFSSDAGEEGLDVGADTDANFVVLENLGIVILNASEEESAMAMAATPQDQNVVIEPEYWNQPLGSEMVTADLEDEPLDDVGEDLAGEGAVSRDFLLGARKMLDMMLEQQGSSATAADTIGAARRCFRDTASFTWGLQATEVHRSALSGQGVRVAVLDSGFDASHPDFAGRTIRRASFIPASEPDNDVNDRNGHGTHCIGTSCGSRRPSVGPRYGVAHGAEIFSGKVLRQSSRGASGADGWILAGIDWAMRNRCQVISMSLGSRATSAQFPMAYERAAQRGLRAGTLILAATGNDSNRRSGHIAPVGRPANCPSIAGVSALDSCLRVANFSNGQRFGRGGEVNFTGPGVAVLSSVPMPRRRAVFNGTSMATPHAAGVAALICQQTGQTGISLYRAMRSRALSLGSRRDFGNGLVRV